MLTTAARRTPADQPEETGGHRAGRRRCEARRHWQVSIPRSSSSVTALAIAETPRQPSSAHFSTAIAKPGKYRVRRRRQHQPASDAPVDIHHAVAWQGSKSVSSPAKRRRRPWIDLGTYGFGGSRPSVWCRHRARTVTRLAARAGCARRLRTAPSSARFAYPPPRGTLRRILKQVVPRSMPELGASGSSPVGTSAVSRSGALGVLVDQM